MPVFGLVLLVQIALVIHVIRTGRSMIWIYVIVFVPAVGCLAYAAVELLPMLWGSRTSRGLQSGARRLLDPGAELRQAARQLEVADTIDNRRRYALALLAQGNAPEAVALLERSVVGIHADDPGLLIDLAKATFAMGDAARTLDALERARAASPQLRSADAHLLYARALEALGRDDEAAAEYRALVDYFPGEEARCRYALLLERRGEAQAAQALFAEVVARQRHEPGYYRRQQRDWIALARGRAGSGQPA